MVGIVDYNMGNLASVFNACKKVGCEADIQSNPEQLLKYDKLILPGVGAFGDAMEHLQSSGLKDAIIEFAKSGKELFGICLGMQLLFESSQEFGNTKGLGLIEGEVVAFDKNKFENNLKIPHMGWNKLFVEKENKLFNDSSYLYFVHSYYVKTDEKNIIGSTYYGHKFTSAVQKDNIFGLQPHPEKSHDDGLNILKNFLVK